MKPYENLMNAVVEQAVRDYRDGHEKKRIAKEKLKQNPEDKKAHRQFCVAVYLISSSTRFFRSDHFNNWTRLDGKRLLSELQKEQKEKKEDI